jgi:hypothetical protein
MQSLRFRTYLGCCLVAAVLLPGSHRPAAGPRAGRRWRLPRAAQGCPRVGFSARGCAGSFSCHEQAMTIDDAIIALVWTGAVCRSLSCNWRSARSRGNGETAPGLLT